MSFIQEFIAITATAVFAIAVTIGTAKGMDLSYLDMSLDQLSMIRF